MRPPPLRPDPGLCYTLTSGSAKGLLAQQWKCVARAFKIKRVWEVDLEDGELAADLLPHPQGEHNMLVVVSSSEGKPLEKFYHPNRAIYLFGPDDANSLDPFLGDVEHVTLRLPSGYLWAAQAGVMVFYDRLMKQKRLLEMWRTQ